jgi:NAD-dependent DNA ligase
LGGIIADNVITEAELKGLSEWLMNHDHLKTCWPYDEIDSIVTAVMSDQKIDRNEHKTLMELFSEFIKLYDDKTITNPPLLEGKTVTELGAFSLTGLCAVSPNINFKDSVFCFTGSFSQYKREDLKDLVIKYGGKFSNSVTKIVDYLVIGSEGNPCWAYACYGRKVEEAVNLRKKGHRLLLVHENDFQDAVADCKP